jgi:hypothetical protein
VTKIVNNTASRLITSVIALAVGLFAASDSYTHIFALALAHGQGTVSAALLPLAGDGTVAAASSAMMVASRQGLRSPVIARVVLLGGIGATMAANIAYGLRSGTTGALLSVWPVAGYVGCMELLAWVRVKTGMQPAAQPASAVAEPDAPLLADELASRRDSRTGEPEPDAPDLMTLAAGAFPGAGPDSVPSLREIQRALHVGQGKAQQVQAHFASRHADAI